MRYRGRRGGLRLAAANVKRGKADTRIEDSLADWIRIAKLPAAERQYRFAKALKRRFSADYAWPEFKVLVEVQGGVWRRGGGAHSHPLDILRDIERAKFAALLGWYILPVTTDEVKTGSAVEWIRRVLVARGWTPGEA